MSKRTRRGLLVAAAWTVVAAGSAVYVYLAVRLPGGPDGMSDLHVYLGAVRVLLEGGNLYDFVSFNGDRFLYPPFAGLAFTPFLCWSEPALRVVWTLLQCLEVLLLAWAVVVRAPVPPLVRLPRRAVVPVLGCLLMMSQPVFTGLFLGQVSLLVTLLTLVDALDLAPRRWRGVAIGVAAAVKLTPLVFVPYLWLTGRRRSAVVSAGTFTAMTALAWVTDPRGSRTFWSSVSRITESVDLAQRDNQSLQGLFARADLHGPLATSALLATAVVVGTLAYRRSRRLHQQGQRLAGAVVVGALAVVVSPISWSHHQTPLVLAAACLVSATSRRANAVWAGAVLLVLSVPFQVLAPQLWAAEHLLTELVLVGALAIAVAVPFRGGAVPSAPARAASSGAANGTSKVAASSSSPMGVITPVRPCSSRRR